MRFTQEQMVTILREADERPVPEVANARQVHAPRAAREAGDTAFADLLVGKAREFYQRDRDCPLTYEPSGEDFLSPCLGEADLMRRVLTPAAFARWLTTLLPGIPRRGARWLTPAIVTDPSDPKLAHLDGLNLSRAWMLEGIAAGLPRADPRIPALGEAAERHRKAGLAAVTGEHYEGGHWLGSFAVYLVTRRGLASERAGAGTNPGASRPHP